MPEEKIEKEKRRFIMKKCVALAQRGEGKVGIDPLMGVLIYYKDILIEETYRKEEGDDPLLRALEQVRDKSILPYAVVYTNIEPSCERSKIDGVHALIKYHVGTIVIGAPNIHLSVIKRSIPKLIKTGTETHTKVLLKECINMNRRYFCFQNNKKPYVILNYFNNEENETLNKEIFENWRKQTYIKEKGFLLHCDNIFPTNEQYIYSADEKRTPTRLVVDPNSIIPSYYYVCGDDFKTIFFNTIEEKKEDGKDYIKIETTSKEIEEILPPILNFCYNKKIVSIIIENKFTYFDYFFKNSLWNEINFIQSKHDTPKKNPLNLPETFLHKLKREKELIIQTYFNKN